MEKNNVCAVIVSYNPEENIYKNMNTLKNIVDYVIIVDNGSSSINSLNSLKKIEFSIENCKIVYNNCNKGIAYALNQGCKLAIEKGFDWVLTLDDDSSVPENMVDVLLEKYEELNDNKIKILAPIITDFSGKNKNVKSMYIDTAITSGSLMKLDSFDKVGFFEEAYFIDMVDIEYCFRLKSNGYKIYQVAEAILYHRLGRQKSILKIGKREWKALNHNEIRKYYIYRNTFQMYKRYFFKYPIPLLLSTKGVLKIFIDTLVIEENKAIKVKMMIKGIFDGIFNRMGSLDQKEISR
ncbi:MAG TPA: glycosyltransferase family 2 protein [Metabacillus sp.]|nr:glycosyltransferase family 2 protein [Metabacillus sp.]